MKVIVDIKNKTLKMLENERAIFKGEYSADKLELYINKQLENEYPVITGLLSNGRRIGAFTTDDAYEFETIDGVEYTRADFTLSKENGFSLSEGLTQITIWIYRTKDTTIISKEAIGNVVFTVVNTTAFNDGDIIIAGDVEGTVVNLKVEMENLQAKTEQYLPLTGGKPMTGNLKMKGNNIIFDNDNEETIEIGEEDDEYSMSIRMEDSDYYKGRYRASGFSVGNDYINATLDISESKFEMSSKDGGQTSMTPDGFNVSKNGNTTFYESGRIARYTDNYSKYDEIKLPNKSGTIATIDDIPTKTSQLTNDSNYATTNQLFSKNYNDLTNKPSIPSSTSQLTNNSGFITNAVNNLTNYYLKSETYTKSEVQQLLSTISSLKLEVVTNLPTTNISSNTIYLKSLDSAKENNIYEEYIYINSKWETIGTTAVDLSNYALKEDIPTKTSQLTNDSDLAYNYDITDALDNFNTDVVEPRLERKFNFMTFTVEGTSTISDLYQAVINKFGDDNIPCILQLTGFTGEKIGLLNISLVASTSVYKIRFIDLETALTYYGRSIVGTTTITEFIMSSNYKVNNTNFVTNDDIGTINPITGLQFVSTGNYLQASFYDESNKAITSFKTINGQSIAGTGDITIEGGSGDSSITDLGTVNSLDDEALDVTEIGFYKFKLSKTGGAHLTACFMQVGLYYGDSTQLVLYTNEDDGKIRSAFRMKNSPTSEWSSWEYNNYMSNNYLGPINYQQNGPNKEVFLILGVTKNRDSLYPNGRERGVLLYFRGNGYETTTWAVIKYYTDYSTHKFYFTAVRIDDAESLTILEAKDIPYLEELTTSSITEDMYTTYTYAKSTDIPTKTSQLENDSGYTKQEDLNNYLPLSGGTMTGDIDMAYGTITGVFAISGSEYDNTNNIFLGYDGDQIGISSTFNEFIFTNSKGVSEDMKHYLAYPDPSSNGVNEEYTWTLPSKSGTIALLEDLQGIGGGGSGGQSVPLAVEITYAELKALRDSSNLVVGQQYRITDYQCTTTEPNTKSGNHQFDIIVVADSKNTLNENARAVQHEGDTYFADSNLSAWELKYDLDNDTTKYSWADEVNGKGVIYWLKDEFKNECPYDFKNIQFIRESFIDEDNGITFTNIYFYTFSAYDYLESSGIQSDIQDASIITKKESIDDYYNICTGNIIKPYFNDVGSIEDPLNILNDIIFINRYSIDDSSYFMCFNNTFGNDCSHNTFGNNCSNNTFGALYHNNTFGYGCVSNTFGYGCVSNTFGNDCFNNTFGNDCFNNTFGNDCFSNTFGALYHNNTFGYGCVSNTFGNNCSHNTFGNNCSNNTFGNNCSNITFAQDYCQYITIENGCKHLEITSDDTEAEYGHSIQNIHIHQGVSGDSIKQKVITVARNLDYETNVVATGSITIEV